MLEVRKSKERGRFELDWLKSSHTFSFGSYYDPRYMGFRSLRVINEDAVQPGGGFPPHSHRDMEIISYVTAGELAHEDSMQNGSIVKPGEIQYMRAGSGVRHSEHNASGEVLKFLQIWVQPNRLGSAPAYDQRAIDETQRQNRLYLLASGDERDGRVVLQQDARLYTALLDPGAAVSYELGAGRGAWVQVVRGALEVNGKELEAGDGAAIEDEPSLHIVGKAPSELLLFDLGA
ncbi:MAG TPA: pirin family protein [Polyangiaceae bacterium]|nr:pirin family protein [Polyangiaceae bacterium]